MSILNAVILILGECKTLLRFAMPNNPKAYERVSTSLDNISRFLAELLSSGKYGGM